MDDTRLASNLLLGGLQDNLLVIGGYWRSSIARIREREVPSLYQAEALFFPELESSVYSHTYFPDGGFNFRQQPKPFLLISVMESLLPKGSVWTQGQRSALRWPTGKATTSWLSLASRVLGGNSPIQKCFSWKAFHALLVRSTPESSPSSTVADRIWDLEVKCKRWLKQLGVQEVAMVKGPLLYQVAALQVLCVLRHMAKDLEMASLTELGPCEVEILQVLEWFYPRQLPKYIRTHVDEYIRIEAMFESNPRIYLLMTFASGKEKKRNLQKHLTFEDFYERMTCEESLKYFLETEPSFRKTYFDVSFGKDWPEP
ncbi:nonstructural protein [Kismaayo virus]|uniref:Nonstructural protein n=1 Tax=Kismaayo virus TaxID=2847813 RepID=A0A097SRW4_9VIRU|nr:nonstructural protein [Kismaayo virus]AIU95036.1 nonstructural protein [Kismaayo virus]